MLTPGAASAVKEPPRPLHSKGGDYVPGMLG